MAVAVKPQVEATSIRSMILAAIQADPGADPESIAHALLRQLAKDRNLVETVFPLVLNEVVDISRNLMREREHEWMREQAVGVVGIDVAGMARATLGGTHFVPLVGYIPFGEMTVAHHQARIDYLEGQRAGLARTVELHQKAIEAIEAAGVECLDDLGAAGANRSAQTQVGVAPKRRGQS